MISLRGRPVVLVFANSSSCLSLDLVVYDCTRLMSGTNRSATCRIHSSSTKTGLMSAPRIFVVRVRLHSWNSSYECTPELLPAILSTNSSTLAGPVINYYCFPPIAHSISHRHTTPTQNSLIDNPFTSAASPSAQRYRRVTPTPATFPFPRPS